MTPRGITGLEMVKKHVLSGLKLITIILSDMKRKKCLVFFVYPV
jgi:hypothetical protein